jgi:hypothetical protein
MRRLALTLVLAALGGLTATALAEAAVTPSQRTDVMRLLGPLGTLERVVQDRLPRLREIGSAWLAETRPCLEAASTELTRLRETEALTGAEGRRARLTLAGVAFLDVSVEASERVDGALRRAQRRYRSMRVSDRTLRSGARGKSREIAEYRALGEIDTCAFAQAWTAGGFKPDSVPEAAPGLGVEDAIGGVRATRQVLRAARRLRRLGVIPDVAGAFARFPLTPLIVGALRQRSALSIFVTLGIEDEVAS